MKRRAVVVLAASLATAGFGAEPKLPADLLEFLGSLDGADPEWQDFLAGTDVRRVAKRVKPPPATATPPPDSSKVTDAGKVSR